MATKASAQNVDFSNVKDGGAFNTKRIEAGDYLAKITKVEDSPVKNGDNKGRAQYLFTIKLVDMPSSTFPYYCQLTDNQLWKLRNILVAAGKSVPKRKQKVDPNVIVGKLIGVAIEDDEYEGKERSTINGVFPPSDLPGAPDDGAASDDEDEEVEEEVEETEEEVEEEVEAEEEADDEEEAEAEADPTDSMTRLELKAAIKAVQADFQAKKSQTDDDLREVLRGLQGSAEEADEDDEEEEEAPAPKKASAAKKTSATRKTRAKAKPAPVDDEDLDELDIDNL